MSTVLQRQLAAEAAADADSSSVRSEPIDDGGPAFTDTAAGGDDYSEGGSTSDYSDGEEGASADALRSYLARRGVTVVEADAGGDGGSTGADAAAMTMEGVAAATVESGNVVNSATPLDSTDGRGGFRTSGSSVMADLAYLQASGVEEASGVVQGLLGEAAEAASCAMFEDMAAGRHVDGGEGGGDEHSEAGSGDGVTATADDDDDDEADDAATTADPLYDEAMDDVDDAWVAAQRLRHRGERIRPDRGGAASLAAPSITLCCPACFTVVALSSAVDLSGGGGSRYRAADACNVAVDGETGLPLADTSPPLLVNPLVCEACSTELGGFHAGSNTFYFTGCVPGE